LAQFAVAGKFAPKRLNAAVAENDARDQRVPDGLDGILVALALALFDERVDDLPVGQRLENALEPKNFRRGLLPMKRGAVVI